MKMIRTLPTDKNGEIYYGPKTAAEAEAAIQNLDADAATVVAQMRNAGYTRAASLVAKKFLD